MEIRLTKQINAPIHVTFDLFSDVTQIAERVEGIQTVEMLSETVQGVGTRWRETRVMFGQTATEEMEISDFQPNKSYDVVAESNGTKYHTQYTFAERDGVTFVEMVFSGTPTTTAGRVMSVFNFLFAGATRKALEADMDDLKRIAESQ